MSAVLDIIIARRDENIGGVRNFMDMLMLQRNISRGQFRVILLQMKGKRPENTMEEFVRQYPYDIVVKQVDTDNLSAALNYGISISTSPWIMFINYGDLFADVYSLSMVMNVLPTDICDVMWMMYYQEMISQDSNIFVGTIGDSDNQINGKLFRRQYLIDNDIKFDETMTHDEGRVFTMTALSATMYSRFAKLNTQFYPLCSVYKKATGDYSEYDCLRRFHETNLAIVKNVEKHTNNYQYVSAIMHAFCDAYYYLNVDNKIHEIGQLEREIVEFYKKYKDIIIRIKPNDLEVFLDDGRTEMLNVIQQAHYMYGHDIYIEDNMPYDKWLQKIDKMSNGISIDSSLRMPSSNPIVYLPADQGLTDPKRKDKVAVFCGTRNVYDQMETAAKSLVYHTPMDRVYFIIEDNTFPRALPDNFIVINVKDQKFFDPNGVNFKNAWTYMCMMRAAFTKLLPDEHLVLSMDIDIIVNDDISELWDIDLTRYYIAGVNEPEKSSRHMTTYANFGVIMMNLDKMRNDGLDDKMIESLNHDRWGLPEQDSFNYFCEGKIYELDPMYNVTCAAHITGESDVEKITHYAGIKYWKHFRPYRKYVKLSWDEVMQDHSNEERDDDA